MSLVQDRLLMAASAVLEGIWMYAMMAVLGLMFQFGGSPLSWVAALAIIGVSLIVARMSAIIIMHPILPFIIQMVFGAIVIYLTLGAQVQTDGQGFSMGWIGALRSEDAPQDYPLMVGLAGLFGALLWWRGARLASVEYPVEHISKHFRFGLMILAVAAIVDIIAEENLKIFLLMFVFFAAGLGGLSVAHLLPASEQAVGARSWSRVISGIVLQYTLSNCWRSRTGGVRRWRGSWRDVPTTPGGNRRHRAFCASSVHRVDLAGSSHPGGAVFPGTFFSSQDAMEEGGK